MKRNLGLAIFGTVVIVLLAISGVYAGTAGGTAPAVGRVNVSLTVPKPAKVSCATLAALKAGTASFDVSGTTMVNWKAFNSDTDSTAAVVKRKFNSNTAYISASGEYNLPIDGKVSTLVFGKFSSANNTTNIPRVCVEMN